MDLNSNVGSEPQKVQFKTLSENPLVLAGIEPGLTGCESSTLPLGHCLPILYDII